MLFTRFSVNVNYDEIVKTRRTAFFVIPAKAGIQYIQIVAKRLDSGFHRSDDFLRIRQLFIILISNQVDLS
ncbi:hypothetical protein ES703_116662 [subsurface metagenome]|jgi:hypothetical protein